MMQVSVLRPLVRLSMVPKQIKRAIVTVETNEHTTLKPWTDIPGPRSFPIFGTVHHFLPGGEFYKLNSVQLLEKLYNSYGPIVKLRTFFEFEKQYIFLYDAQSVEQASIFFAYEFNNIIGDGKDEPPLPNIPFRFARLCRRIHRGENEFPIRNAFGSLVYYRTVHKEHRVPNKPTGLLSEHGELWKEFRSIVNPVLLQPKTIKLYTEALNEIAMEVIERMKTQRDENNQIKDWAKDLNLWALESISVIALGCRMNCLDPSIKENSPVYQLIDVVKNSFRATDALDFKPSLWKLFATSAFKNAMKTYEQQEILARYFIDEAVKDIERNPKPDNQKGVLEKLLNINKDFAYIMASDMILAGVDTTSNAVLRIIYLLAKNTEKQIKLREELRINPGNKTYLKACIKEGFRLMPIAAANIRETTKEYSILGYKIPKGCHVAFAHQNMSLMEEYFVRPDEYLPERWIAEKDDLLCYRNAHPFAYNPFGFGARGCIGRRIAELEMESFIGQAIENFEIEWFGPPPKQAQTLVSYIEEPRNFIFKDAKM